VMLDFFHFRVAMARIIEIHYHCFFLLQSWVCATVTFQG
jgi:hypothetical protein